ncbi:MAG: amidohydrolase [archaeon]|nr:amidohydrolase [archaeon]
MDISLYFNCNILTVDEKNTETEAMAINGDKIQFIGTEVDVRNDLNKFIEEKKTSNNEKINIIENDLNGSCIVPGFIDAHLHPILCIYFKTQLDLSEVKSYSDLKKVIIAEDEKITEKDAWIFGLDLMEDRFEDPNEQFFPDRYDLDKISPNRPVLVLRHDGHICAVNSVALKEMNLNEETLDDFIIDSGEIKIDEEGKPIGIFTENATSIAIEKVSVNIERLREASKDFSRELSSVGITTCGGILQLIEEGPSGKMGTLEAPFMQNLIKEGLIEQDYVFFLITDKPRKHLKRMKKAFQKLNSVYTDQFVVGGLKMFADGTFGASTAYMFEPFADSEDFNSGFMLRDREYLLGLAKETNDLGLGFHIECHSIGDKSSRIVVDMFKDFLNQINDNLPENKKKKIRCHIEHASQLNNEIIKDAVDLGLIFVVQPMFIESEYTWLEKRLGSERIGYTYAFRSMIDAGGIVAGSSDAPIESFNVLDAIKICITRNGFVPEQCITINDGLRMFTYNAAFALGQENIKGSLEKGKLADFVILDRNILEISPQKLSDVKIMSTYHRGKMIYNNE